MHHWSCPHLEMCAFVMWAHKFFWKDVSLLKEPSHLYCVFKYTTQVLFVPPYHIESYKLNLYAMNNISYVSFVHGKTLSFLYDVFMAYLDLRLVDDSIKSFSFSSDLNMASKEVWTFSSSCNVLCFACYTLSLMISFISSSNKTLMDIYIWSKEVWTFAFSCNVFMFGMLHLVWLMVAFISFLQ